MDKGCTSGRCCGGTCADECGGCFPAAASVAVEGRGMVHMAELDYGDRVLARDRATGQLVFREVGTGDTV
jgi:hypothetical protein